MAEPQRKIGDRVLVTADNSGGPATIIGLRDDQVWPPAPYLVRMDTGEEFWAFTFEVEDMRHE